mgnify:CR=1 FL=1
MPKPIKGGMQNDDENTDEIEDFVNSKIQDTLTIVGNNILENVIFELENLEDTDPMKVFYNENTDLVNSLNINNWSINSELKKFVIQYVLDRELKYGVYFYEQVQNPGIDELEEIRTLLDYGANVNILYESLDVTPLFFAMRDNKTELVKLLLQRGAIVRDDWRVNYWLRNINEDIIKLVEEKEEAEASYNDAIKRNKSRINYSKIIQSGKVYENRIQATPIELTKKIGSYVMGGKKTQIGRGKKVFPQDLEIGKYYMIDGDEDSPDGFNDELILSKVPNLAHFVGEFVGVSPIPEEHGGIGYKFRYINHPALWPEKLNMSPREIEALEMFEENSTAEMREDMGISQDEWSKLTFVGEMVIGPESSFFEVTSPEILKQIINLDNRKNRYKLKKDYKISGLENKLNSDTIDLMSRLQIPDMDSNNNVSDDLLERLGGKKLYLNNNMPKNARKTDKKKYTIKKTKKSRRKSKKNRVARKGGMWKYDLGKRTDEDNNLEDIRSYRDEAETEVGKNCAYFREENERLDKKLKEGLQPKIKDPSKYFFNPNREYVDNPEYLKYKNEVDELKMKCEKSKLKFEEYDRKFNEARKISQHSHGR